MPGMARLGVVTGLTSEARLIERAFARRRRPRPAIACTGPGSGRARKSAEQLLAQGVEALVSFGLCAGLDPALRAGEMVLAEHVLAESEPSLPTATERRAALVQALNAAGLRVAGGSLLSTAAPVSTAEAKRDLYARFEAQAADMESHGVARAAAAAGVPFLVVRAVSDPAGRSLPAAARDAIGPDGRIKLIATLTKMYLRPWEGPAMIRLAYETRLAVDALERVAEPDGPLFGGD